MAFSLGKPPQSVLDKAKTHAEPGIFRPLPMGFKDSLPDGCIVTDVGSTKVVPYKRATRLLPDSVHYVGSHLIAGLEQRGVDFARDDLYSGALCILTVTKNTNSKAVQVLEKFWTKLGCFVKIMTPTEHDRIFATVSHVPHLIAAGMINATDSKEMKFAGKGFIDTSRVASGPADIWTDILLTNHENTVKGIDKVIDELNKIKMAINRKDSKQIEKLLNLARDKRAALIDYKIKQKEII